MSYQELLETIDQVPETIVTEFANGTHAEVFRDPGNCLITIDLYREGEYLSTSSTDDREIARAILVHLEIQNDD